MIYGRTTTYLPSRFLAEIPDEYIERLVVRANSYGFANSSVVDQRGYGGGASFRPSARQMGSGASGAGQGHPQSALQALNAMRERTAAGMPIVQADGVIRPDMDVVWKPGDKARHGKWGVGTVVSVKGSGEEVELKIAFPGQGVKGLMQKYAPIAKVDE